MTDPRGGNVSEVRFTLGRVLREATHSRALLWVMLNPSTADAHVDDPTIRRVVGFTERFGCDALVVANLFAQRATDPEALKLPEPADIARLNWRVLCNLVSQSNRVVCAWGAHRAAVEPGERLHAMCQVRQVPTVCLGTTKSGAPRHPLYVKGDTDLEPWSPAE